VISLIVSTIPNLSFGLKIQIDQLKSVAKLHDTPRKVVVNLNWILNILSYINAFIPFCKKGEQFSIPYEIGKVALYQFKLFRDITNCVMTLARSHLTMGFHIIGLLSSSWQGGNVQGGKRREVIEKSL
jgi:hypothetical protein